MSNLHETTHWRRFKRIIREVLRTEGIKKDKYNLDRVICYRTLGSELQGKNTKFIGTRAGASCWVSTNTYDFYEIPTYRK